jgi:hypothetical protein
MVDYPRFRLDELLLRVYPRNGKGIVWRILWSAQRIPRATSAIAEIVTAWDNAMNNARQPMTESDRLTMISYHHLALLNIREGSASEQSWSCLALASNLALVLAELGYGEDWIPMIQRGQAGLMRAKGRGDRSSSWRLDGAGMTSVGEMLDIFDAQLEIAPRMAIVRAREILLERMANNEILAIEENPVR